MEVQSPVLMVIPPGKKVGCAQVNGHKLDVSRTAEGCCLLSWKGRSDWGRFLLAG